MVRGVLVTPVCGRALRHWRAPSFLTQGVPMDASLSGWGGLHEGYSVRGRWSMGLQRSHIHFLELSAGFLSLKGFLPSLTGHHVLVRTDNATTVAYINHQGGLRSRRLHMLARKSRVALCKPVCKIQGKAEYGQNINLTCLSEDGSPTPVYTWEQRDVRNAPRIPDSQTSDKGGILSLYNISIETSGYYTCTSRNKIRSASCNITLSVAPPSMNMGVMAGFIGGGIGILLILGIVIYCCCCKKKKGTPAEGEFHEKGPMVNGSRDRRDERAEEDQSEASDHDGRRSDYDDCEHARPKSPSVPSNKPSSRANYDD